MQMADSTLSLSSNLSDDLSLLSPTSSQFSSSSEFNLDRDLLPEELPVVKCVARARIPTTNNTEIFLHLYSNNIDKKEHLAIVFGENIRSKSLYLRQKNETQSDRMIRGAYIGKLQPNRKIADFDELKKIGLKFNEKDELIYDNRTSYNPENPILVRIHSECYTGETTWSARCDCGEQFDEAGRLMGEYGRGVIIYLRQEGRGIGLGEKLKAYNLQDLGADTVQANLMLRHPADARSFSLATSILLDLNLPNIKLLTNNPDKILAVEGKNRLIRVVERIPMIPIAWRENLKEGIQSKEINGYLRTKIERMGHLLQEPIRI
ncbi:GTP cyclohydrolase II [Ascoidea rubescens DSM 1968]|uniref:GTP cyclohydrolase II n=1 Tax=Ascoidea rubescens DSM 1968 TaxID=1344418 RepID=A0A1D2VML1_9ASCO|nr:GTP cyclohydrolase II [Ascoidea rubescens DSM 1968]ODV62840.1 GTP cyclohydrolase II [Ascoidea rubescens DSM 1968]